MKKWFGLLACCLLLWGCAPVEEGTGGGASGVEVEVDETDSNVTVNEAETSNEGLTLVKVSVPGMTCAQGCPPVVKSTLAHCGGVKNVEVDFDSKMATVSVTPEEFDGQAAIDALAGVGFEGSALAN